MEYKEIYNHEIKNCEECEDGNITVKYELNGKKVFESEMALSVLLLERQIFLNSNWYMDDWPKDAQNMTSLNVNCNDVFAWGCADAEDVEFKEIKDLFEHYIKDPGWGTAVWCIKRRGYLPQKPVYEAIQKNGIWNLDELCLKDGYDGSIDEMKK